MIHQTQPDVIITDIKMPVMDGLTMLKTISSRSFETIIMSGFAEFEYAQQAMELGIAHFIVKPIEEEKLTRILLKVKETIENKRQIELIKEYVHNKGIVDVFEGKQASILSSTSHDLIDNALDYIHKNYTKRISLYSLAEELKMSSSHVSRTFKKMTSFNVNEYINRYRVNQSMSLLVEGKYKLYEIASMCGFKEYKYYYHVFTQYVQMSPKEFIKTAYLIDKKNNTTL